MICSGIFAAEGISYKDWMDCNIKQPVVVKERRRDASLKGSPTRTGWTVTPSDQNSKGEEAGGMIEGISYKDKMDCNVTTSNQ